jgi:allantoinase
MTDLDPSYLEYKQRQRGMDHARYGFASLQQRSSFQWPKGPRLALCMIVCVEYFPLDQQGKPFKVPGGMTTAYPDLRHYSLREYGNRIGVYRVLDALQRVDARAAFALSAALCERYPLLVDTLAGQGEIIAHGVHMDALHATGVEPETERRFIRDSTVQLRAHTQQAIKGWLSPARSQSAVTPDLLTEHGIAYCCDWVNDELPYQQSTAHGPLMALPAPIELDDQFVITQNMHSEISWAQQCCDAFDFLRDEANQSQQARLLTLVLHPWLIGQPHRIGALERVLAHTHGHSDVAYLQPLEAVQHAMANSHQSK